MTDKTANRTEKKQLVIHDLEIPGGAAWADAWDIIDSGAIHKRCVGCFGCWTKTPAVCVIRDGFQNIGERFAACDELVIVSRCVYGGFSPGVKNVLDRCIGYLLPFFTLRSDGQMHHVSRYDAQLALTVHFYGDITPGERQTAEKLVERNALNLNAAVHAASFYGSAEQIGGRPA